jgi:long-chain acyl-CoA synthetase
MIPATLPELRLRRMQLTPAAEAYRQYDPERGTWVSVTWRDFEQRVREFGEALRREPLPAGARIAILVPNSVEHLCMDQAALSLGLVPVPMHMIDQPESLAYVLGDSGASFLFTDSAAHWQALEPLASQFPGLKRVVYLTGSVPARDGIGRSLADWLEGAQSGAAEAGAGPFRPPTPTDLAAIVYTSGTTGRPKGVMLSHRNVVSNVYAVLGQVPVYESDVFLSFLPLSHTLERTAGYYLPMAAGATVAFARSVQTLVSDLVTVRPTVLISVPRIYERAYTAIRESLANRPLSRAAFALAVRIGWRRFLRSSRKPKRLTLIERWLWPLLDRRIASQVRERFGGRLRAAVTGGAPIQPSVERTFLALGLPLLEGYGLTESSPVVACNRLGEAELGSVGPPLSGVEVRIGDRDELLVRGPSVMLGYWRRSEDTARVLDPEGWLHTGDQASIEHGRLYIRGRIKDIIVTSTGEKIAPADLESAILGDPLFEQVMVIGEGRSFLAALAVLNREHWIEEANRLGLDPTDARSLRARATLDWALERIGHAVRSFPGYAKPRAVVLSLEPWTVDNGLMTPTLKPKRPGVENRFAAEIAELYLGHTV